MFQPPGTPEINAIEHLWHPIKQRCRKLLLENPTKNYTQEEFMQVVVQSCTTITKKETENVLRGNLGYILKMLHRKQAEESQVV